MHVMIDIETLGLDHDCHILSIGASQIWGGGEFYRLIKPGTQDRHIDDGTVRWWMNQNEDAQREVFGKEGDADLKQALIDFKAWVLSEICDSVPEKLREVKYWSHGATFDLMILENAFKQYNIAAPWQYWNMRDTRTLFDLVDKSELPKRMGTHHNALDDALHQATCVRYIYDKLRAGL
jgi:DNA polymerase III epsilon subunit-like protein